MTQHMTQQSVRHIALAGLLIALGIIIPMFSPFKIVLEPASFTLASHVAIFIAMFISPRTSAAVALGTAVGFFLGGFPLVVVLRAASHIVFAVAGALYLRKNTQKQDLSRIHVLVFAFIIAGMHALVELVIVGIFYFGGTLSTSYYHQGFVLSILWLVGLGTIIHSLVDFEIARFLMIHLRKAGVLLPDTGKI